jgi:hypothetical protein
MAHDVRLEDYVHRYLLRGLSPHPKDNPEEVPVNRKLARKSFSTDLGVDRGGAMAQTLGVGVEGGADPQNPPVKPGSPREGW